MAVRVGVDIGGTFTDLILYDEETGGVKVGKVPTTPDAPETGCMNAVREVVDAPDIRNTAFFFHGTTVGLNALLERRGTRVGLLCTRGFRDILEIRRGDRADVYGLFWQPPEPIVPRHLRMPVGGRIDARGAEVAPLDAEDIAAAARVFTEHGVGAVAIVFMHGYANGVHEREAARTLRTLGFKGEISLSHEVSGEYREYERTCTTCIDAFVRARMSRYLDRLHDDLKSSGFSGSALITRSGGGSMSFQEAGRRPFETIMSGPVAGVEGAAELSRRFGLGDLVTADVGGTSFDTSLVVEGRPTLMFEGEIAGMPLQTSWVDVRSIGSGGGSIACVDEGGLLRVGPRSAAAVPGPACYGRGGEEPCMTDAAFHLGMLGDGVFASGMRLDHQLCEAAIDRIAGPLGLELDVAARGIMEISAAAMASAIREITIEQGRDPRTLKLIAFGGAGPLMSTLLAREMDMRTVLIPPHAGNFSAWGMLGADIVREAARTRVTPLSEAGVNEVNALLGELFAELERRSPAIDVPSRERHVMLDMRYTGQEHCLAVAMPNRHGSIAAGCDAIRASFVEEYKRTFGVVMEAPVEVVSVRAGIRAPLPDRLAVQRPAQQSAADDGLRLDAFSFALGKRVPFRVIERCAIGPRDRLAGPLIVLEPTTTTYVDAGFECSLHESGCLQLEYDAGLLAK
ncbi:hydantoinase/oxoprolinase family protein [Paraburkholderia oxyphila]|uniref:hydantoinase/oxoprolinase family protein n=1 Tax=Paraburkholderia oxyphila TaxID=614212 RepID=UPI00048670E7|nr:hydantoinase/oxoprolinase family protein [Paraburkholderia oxyphila]